jgi:hypothetical protein
MGAEVARRCRQTLPSSPGGSALATNPDPTLKLETVKGVTRTLDDWTTMFHVCVVVLPPRPEATVFIPIAQRIFATFGDADCRCAFVVPGPQPVAEKILGPVADQVLTFLDPNLEFVESLGLERLPAFVHLRQDTAVVAAAEGWDPQAWQQVAKEVGAALAWTVPEVAGPGDPRPTLGWTVSGL